MGHPPLILRTSFTTDQRPGKDVCPLAQEYFKQGIGVAWPGDDVPTS
jgi:hypothetical protein